MLGTRCLPYALLATLAMVLSAGVTALSPGQVLVPGAFPAVGKLKAAPPFVNSCTATLIEQRRVLTAAHCVCQPDKVGSCAARATFELLDVVLANAPGTHVNVSIPGTVRVHPEFGLRRWLNEDIAVIDLDYPASRDAPGIAPIVVEHPSWIPFPGTPLHLVGFGHTGSDCKGHAAKRLLYASVTEVNSARLMIKEPGKRNCPGDSGGPMLNQAGRVVGVMSWTGEEINGRPTHANHNFVFALPRLAWTDCNWTTVGGRRSHQAGQAWCANGSYLTQFDLDSVAGASAYDSPVVGQARCCRLAQSYAPWGNCYWASVGVQKSYQPGPHWCTDGYFLTALDLDGETGVSPHAAPIIGKALCCRAQSGPATRWGSTYLDDVGAKKSHQRGPAWCPSGSFITQFELLGTGGYSAHDAPFVGRVRCVRPRP